MELEKAHQKEKDTTVEQSVRALADIYRENPFLCNYDGHVLCRAAHMEYALETQIRKDLQAAFMLGGGDAARAVFLARLVLAMPPDMQVPANMAERVESKVYDALNS